MPEQSGAQEPLDGDYLPYRPDPSVRGRGRPRLYSSPEEFDEQVDAYYRWCLGDRGTDGNGTPRPRGRPEPMTITGLTLFLGFCSLRTFYNYGENYPEFLQSVERARTLISYGYELKLHGPNNAGAKFALSCIDGGAFWKDRKQIEGLPGPQPEDRLAHLR